MIGELVEREATVTGERPQLVDDLVAVVVRDPHLVLRRHGRSLAHRDRRLLAG